MTNQDDKNMVKEKVAEELIDKLLSDKEDISDYVDDSYDESDTSVIELDQSMEPGQFFEIMVKEIDDQDYNKRHKRDEEYDIHALFQEKDDEQSTIGFNVKTQNGKYVFFSEEIKCDSSKDSLIYAKKSPLAF